MCWRPVPPFHHFDQGGFVLKFGDGDFLLRFGHMPHFKHHHFGHRPHHHGLFFGFGQPRQFRSWHDRGFSLRLVDGLIAVDAAHIRWHGHGGPDGRSVTLWTGTDEY